MSKLVVNPPLDNLPAVSFSTTEVPLWDATRYTPLKANGNIPRIWHLEADFNVNGASGDITLNVYASQVVSPFESIGAATIGQAHLGGGPQLHIEGNLFAKFWGGTSTINIGFWGTAVAPDGTVVPIFYNKIAYDPAVDTELTVTAKSSTGTGTLEPMLITLEDLMA